MLFVYFFKFNGLEANLVLNKVCKDLFRSNANLVKRYNLSNEPNCTFSTDNLASSSTPTTGEQCSMDWESSYDDQGSFMAGSDPIKVLSPLSSSSSICTNKMANKQRGIGDAEDDKVERMNLPDNEELSKSVPFVLDIWSNLPVIEDWDATGVGHRLSTNRTDPNHPDNRINVGGRLESTE